MADTEEIEQEETEKNDSNNMAGIELKPLSPKNEQEIGSKIGNFTIGSKIPKLSSILSAFQIFQLKKH